MTENVKTTAEKIFLNEDSNKPVKIKAGDGNYYSTFNPGDDLPMKNLEQGSEIKVEYEKVEKNGKTFRNIAGDGVKVINTTPETSDNPGTGNDQTRQEERMSKGLALKVAAEIGPEQEYRNAGNDYSRVNALFETAEDIHQEFQEWVNEQ